MEENDVNQQSAEPGNQNDLRGGDTKDSGVVSKDNGDHLY